MYFPDGFHWSDEDDDEFMFGDPFFGDYPYDDDDYADLFDPDEEDTNYECNCSIKYGDFKDISQAEIRQLQRNKQILDKFREQRETDPCTDGIIIVDHQQFKVHKSVLQCSSTYFEAMFSRPFNEQSEKSVTLQGITKDMFSMVLEFIYGAKLDITEETLLPLYQGADMLCIDSLIVECKECLKENWEQYSLGNACHFAEVMDEDVVVKSIIDEIYYCTLVKEVSSIRFSEVPETFLFKILEDTRTLTVEASIKLVDVITHWFTHSPTDRLPLAEEIINKFNIRLLPEHSKDKLQKDILDLLKTHLPETDIKKYELSLLNKCETMKESFRNLKINLLIVQQTKDDNMVDYQLSLNHFDFVSWQWQSSLLKVNFKVEDCIKVNKHLYVFGATENLSFNLETGHSEKWQSRADPRTDFTACALKDRIFLASGEDSRTKRPAVPLTSFIFQKGKSWVNCGSWKFAKDKCGMIAHKDSIYIVGGMQRSRESNRDELSKDVYRYIPQSRKLLRFSNLTRGCLKPKLAICDDKLYVFASNDNPSLNVHFGEISWDCNLLLHPDVIDLKTRTAKLSNIQINQRELLSVCSLNPGLLLMSSWIIEDQENICFNTVELANETSNHLGFLPKLPGVKLPRSAPRSIVPPQLADIPDVKKSWIFINK